MTLLQFYTEFWTVARTTNCNSYRSYDGDSFIISTVLHNAPEPLEQVFNFIHFLQNQNEAQYSEPV